MFQESEVVLLGYEEEGVLACLRRIFLNTLGVFWVVEQMFLDEEVNLGAWSWGFGL